MTTKVFSTPVKGTRIAFTRRDIEISPRPRYGKSSGSTPTQLNSNKGTLIHRPQKERDGFMFLTGRMNETIVRRPRASSNPGSVHKQRLIITDVGESP